MALQYEVDSLDGLDEAQKALYAEHGGKFRLSVEGIPDVDGLKKNRDDILKEYKELKAAQAAKDAEAAKAAEEAARKANDAAALEKSWQAKYDKLEAEKQGEIDKRQAAIEGLLVDNTAQQIAGEIAVKGSELLLMPHLKARLGVEERDGRYVTVVKDAAGNVSALSLTELKKEFTDNPAFAAVVVGSKANGGGAAGGGVGSGASGKKPQEMSDAERVALFKENPERFKALFGGANF